MSNILQNPSFEDSPDLVHWNKLGTASAITKSSIIAFDGDYSLRQANPTTDYEGRRIESDKYVAAPNVLYYLTGHLYIKDSGEGNPQNARSHVRLRMNFYDDSLIHLGYGDWNAPSNHGWTTITTWDTWLEYAPSGVPGFSFISPPDTAYISVTIESREVSPTPDNDVFWDSIILTTDYMPPYQKQDRIVAYVGETWDDDDWRITGYIPPPLTPQNIRVMGTVGEYIKKWAGLVTGKIDYIWQYLGHPDKNFLEEESRLCNKPWMKILFFHDELPEQPYGAGCYGNKNYIDISERLITCSSIEKGIPSAPGEDPRIIVSDVTLNVDNSDYYFSDTNDSSPFKDILDADSNYIGWTGSGMVEIWCGFQRYNNVVKLVLKAKMVIAGIDVHSNSGTATIRLRGGIMGLLSKKVGYPVEPKTPAVGRPDPGGQRPLEFPVQSFSEAEDDNWVQFQTNHLSSAVKIYLPDGSWGKHTRAIILEKGMNRKDTEGGLVRGMDVTGQNSDESFSVSYDEELRKYSISASGVDWLKIWFPSHSGNQAKWGWEPGWSYTGTDERGFDSKVEIVDTVNFTWLLEHLLEEIGGHKPADPGDPAWIDIEDIPTINFYNVAWEETDLLTCIAEVTKAGQGVMWADDWSTVFFRQYKSIDYKTKKTLEGNINYLDSQYCGEDADLRIKTLTVTGRRDELTAEIDTGRILGTEYNIAASVVDEATPGLVDDIAKAEFSRFEGRPSLVRVTGVYMPSLQNAQSVRFRDSASGEVIRGHILENNIDPSGFTQNIVLLPVSTGHTWQTKADWDDFVDESEGLYVPTGWNYLQHILLESGNKWRDYVYDLGAGEQAKWSGFDYDADLRHKIFYQDFFDFDPSERYDIITMGAEQWFYSFPHLGSYGWQSPVDGKRGYINVDAVTGSSHLSVFFIIKDLLEAPARYMNYKIWGDFQVDQIFMRHPPNPNLSVGALDAYHHYCLLARFRNPVNTFYAYVKFIRRGHSSPRIGEIKAGRSQSRNTFPGGVSGYSYGRLGERKTFFFDLRDGYESDAVMKATITGVHQTPWTRADMDRPRSSDDMRAGFGFAQTKGKQHDIRLESPEAPDAPEPTFEFWTGEPGDWTSHGTTFPTGVSSRAIKIRVNLNRGDKYCTLPWLKSMAVAYSLA